MARGRLRCIGNSLRLKSRFGSGYRVSIRVQGSSGTTSSGGGTIGTAGPGGSSAASLHDNPLCEIQPDPRNHQQQCQQASGQLPAYHRSGSSAGSRAPAPEAQAQQRDPVAARQAAAVRALFQQQLGIKPSDESLDYVHFLVPYEHESRLPALFSHLKASSMSQSTHPQASQQPGHCAALPPCPSACNTAVFPALSRPAARG